MQRRIEISHYLVTAFFLLSGWSVVNGQSVQPILGNCEDNIAVLTAAHHEAGEKGLIIVIARLGDGEYRPDLNRRRLHNVRVYLTEFDWHRKPETVVTAQGERVSGVGRLELYIAGRLVAVLGVKRNGDLLVGSCEPDDIRPIKAEENLYPFLDRKPRKLRKPLSKR